MARSEKKIADILAAAPGRQVHAVPGTMANLAGYWVRIDGRDAFALLPEDLDGGSGQTLEEVVEKAVHALQEALDARHEQQRLPQLLKGVGLSLAATLALWLALWVITGQTGVQAPAAAPAGPPTAAVHPGYFDAVPHLLLVLSVPAKGRVGHSAGAPEGSASVRKRLRLGSEAAGIHWLPPSTCGVYLYLRAGGPGGFSSKPSPSAAMNRRRASGPLAWGSGLR